MMKNHEHNEHVFDRRKFMYGAGIGLSTLALAGCAETTTPQSPSLSLISTEVPPPPIPTKENQAPKSEQLRTKWQEIIAERPGRIDFAVFDSSNGQTTQFGNSNEKFKTASIIKLSILERLLMIDPSWARDHREHIKPMITQSDNDLAVELWSRVGGTESMQEFFNLIGAPGTIAASGGGLFNTMTTAVDQLKVINTAVYPGILTPDDTDFAKGLMHEVATDQRWGISAGLPSDVAYENKNGWVGRRRNSIGHINGRSIDYTAAGLVDDGPGDAVDIETIELLARSTWNIMSNAK